MKKYIWKLRKIAFVRSKWMVYEKYYYVSSRYLHAILVTEGFSNSGIGFAVKEENHEINFLKSKVIPDEFKKKFDSFQYDESFEIKEKHFFDTLYSCIKTIAWNQFVKSSKRHRRIIIRSHKLRIDVLKLDNDMLKISIKQNYRFKRTANLFNGSYLFYSIDEFIDTFKINNKNITCFIDDIVVRGI